MTKKKLGYAKKNLKRKKKATIFNKEGRKNWEKIRREKGDAFHLLSKDQIQEVVTVIVSSSLYLKI